MVDEGERDGDMRDAKTLAMHTGKGKFLVVVVTAIVERQTKSYGVFILVEHGNRIHAARNDDY